MRMARIVLGIMLILSGATIALQGLNVLVGSYMSGRTEWLIIGVIMLLLGAGLLALGNRPGGRAG